jgi:hypothetical protein
MIPRSKAFKQMVNFLASLPFYHVDHVWEVWIKFSTPCLSHEDEKTVCLGTGIEAAMDHDEKD